MTGTVRDFLVETRPLAPCSPGRMRRSAARRARHRRLKRPGLRFIPPIRGAVGTPTLVQSVKAPMALPATSGSTLTLSFPEGTQSGNCVVLFFWLNSGQTISTVADDQGGSLAGGQWATEHAFTTGQNNNGYIFSRKNCAAGIKVITITGFTIAGNYSIYYLSEWCNVNQTTPIANATHNESTSGSTSWAHSSISPTAGNVVIHGAVQTLGSYTDVSTRFTAYSGFALEEADMFDGFAVESGVAPGGAITPTITAGASTPWVSLACALIAADAGSNPNAFRIVRMSGQNTKNGGSSGTTHTYQFPTDGNLQVVCASVLAAVEPIVSLTSSSVSYSHVSGPGGSSPEVGDGGGGNVSQMYAAGFTPSRTNYGVLTTTGSIDGGATLWFLDVVGAHASTPLVTAAVMADKGTQNAPSGGDLTTHTATPGEQCILVDYVDHDAGSETSMNDPAIGFPIPYAGQDGASGGNWCMDSGLAVKRGSAAVTFQYNRDATPPGPWESVSAGYRAASSAKSVAADGGTYSVAGTDATLVKANPLTWLRHRR